MASTEEVEEDSEDDENADGGIVCRQISVNAKIHVGKRGQTDNRTDWEK